MQRTKTYSIGGEFRHKKWWTALMVIIGIAVDVYIVGQLTFPMVIVGFLLWLVMNIYIKVTYV